MKASHFLYPLVFAGLCLGLNANAQAAGKPHHIQYAQVVDVRPVYERISQQVPRDYCHVETVAYRTDGGSHTGVILGGLIGAAIGNELGHSKRNKEVGMVAGGLLGASIGRDLSRTGSSVRYREEQVCHTRYETEYRERLVGYDVTYRYQGRLHHTQTSRHPGNRIPVDVHVRPARGH
jgi:uncharacterized protein YcfJ